MDESKAPRADVPAMLREIRHEECRCVTASDVGVPATGNPLVYGECPACSLVGLLADYAAAADALLGAMQARGHDVSCLADATAIGPAGIASIIERGGDPEQFPQPCTCWNAEYAKELAAYDAARAALAKALEGGEG